MTFRSLVLSSGQGPPKAYGYCIVDQEYVRQAVTFQSLWTLYC
jgi:hypothetical protein